MPLKRIFIAFLFIITASHVFSFAFIKDMSDWEKEIKRLDCVESLEYELSDPYNDDSWMYNLKIHLTENRYLQIKYFNPYRENRRSGEFYIVRIGDIVPVAWVYKITETYHKTKAPEHDLYFSCFDFSCLNSCIKGKKGIIDLIKNYDRYLMMFNQFPCYSEIFSKDAIIDIDDGDDSTALIWNKYSSPYIYKNQHKNDYFGYWEDYKFYIMTVQEYNNYNISRGWNRNVLEENP